MTVSGAEMLGAASFSRRAGIPSSPVPFDVLSYNRRIVEENSDDPKNFWKAVKKVLPNKSVTSQPSASTEPITVDGKTTTDALTIGNGFRTYFTNVVEKLLSSISPLNWKQLSTEACLINSSQSLLSLKPVSAAFIHRQLRQQDFSFLIMAVT